MSPAFKPNLSSNRAIKFSNERGVGVNPTGEGILSPHLPKMPQFNQKTPAGISTPKITPVTGTKGGMKFGRRFYGEIR